MAIKVLKVMLRDVRDQEVSTSRDAREKVKALGTKMRVYITPVGEGIVEQLFTRHNRPVKEYRKVLDEVMFKAGIDSTQIGKVHWSQKAGCSCGCSPGFIADGQALKGKTIFATIGAE